MSANVIRALFLMFAAALFLLALASTDGGGNRDFIKASVAIGLCVGGSIALVAAATVKKDS